jgi:hypothetical protein
MRSMTAAIISCKNSRQPAQCTRITASAPWIQSNPNAP